MSPHAAAARRLAVPALLGLSWLGPALLLAGTRGDLEGFLHAAFAGRSRPDTFEHVNRLAVPFGILHSCLILLAIAAAWRRRPDVLAVLPIGPAIGLTIGVAITSWSDPNVYDLLAVAAIGWLVGTVVGAAYWAWKPRPPEGPSLAGAAGR
ncbi:hypothetical protein OJF2_38730 [Aquisphaera giovannonii]|uniref:Uncharacterized protein n=1 Tax=Aquisphaera giovannonii TaxID=406548 RepID=A0A5B9W401_9BACT|nr:hypothetical protein [Aquisphaera giovannonii]QEH35322.1 hypothetical protein OJF2_38730 [Aquisphaera giovannonii]